jgi:hypothetical protein
MNRVGHAARARIQRQIPDLVPAGAPGFQVRSVVPLGEGLDNLAYEVNGELVVRVSEEPDPARRAELISAEAGLLAAVADISPLPVPEPVFTDREHGCWPHAKIPGVPLLDLCKGPSAGRHQDSPGQRAQWVGKVAITDSDRIGWPLRRRMRAYRRFGAVSTVSIHRGDPRRSSWPVLRRSRARCRRCRRG